MAALRAATVAPEGSSIEASHASRQACRAGEAVQEAQYFPPDTVFDLYELGLREFVVRCRGDVNFPMAEKTWYRLRADLPVSDYVARGLLLETAFAGEAAEELSDVLDKFPDAPADTLWDRLRPVLFNEADQFEVRRQLDACKWKEGGELLNAYAQRLRRLADALPEEFRDADLVRQFVNGLPSPYRVFALMQQGTFYEVVARVGRILVEMTPRPRGPVNPGDELDGNDVVNAVDGAGKSVASSAAEGHASRQMGRAGEVEREDEEFTPERALKIYQHHFESVAVLYPGDANFPLAEDIWFRLRATFPGTDDFARGLLPSAFTGQAAMILADVLNKFPDAPADSLWDRLRPSLFNGGHHLLLWKQLTTIKWRQRSESLEEFAERVRHLVHAVPSKDYLLYQFIEGLPPRHRVTALCLRGTFHEVVPRLSQILRDEAAGLHGPEVQETSTKAPSRQHRHRRRNGARKSG